MSLFSTPPKSIPITPELASFAHDVNEKPYRLSMKDYNALRTAVNEQLGKRHQLQEYEVRSHVAEQAKRDVHYDDVLGYILQHGFESTLKSNGWT